MPKISKEQVKEWLESPVAELLRGLLESRKTFLQGNRAEIFYPNKPQKTQEAIVELEGRLAEVIGVQTLVEADGEVFFSEVEQIYSEKSGVSANDSPKQPQ